MKPYPPGTCVGCQQPAEHMPLCGACRTAVWSHDGDCWDATDERSQFVRELAAAWRRGYHRGLRKAGLEEPLPVNGEPADA